MRQVTVRGPLLLAMALSSIGSAGCLRFGYDHLRDAGQLDAGPASRAGRGGASASGRSGGAAGSTALDGGDSEAGASWTDAGWPSDGGLAVPTICAQHPGAAFCDGFETSLKWSYQSLENGALAPTHARARSGLWSLRATTRAGAVAKAGQGTLALSMLAAGDAWLRFYAWLPRNVEVARYVSIGVIGEAVSPWWGVELRLLPGQRGRSRCPLQA